MSGTHWFQKCNFWKYSPSSISTDTSMPFEILSKTKMTKILLWKVIKTRWFWNFGLGDIENDSKPQQPRRLPSGFYFELYIFEISGLHWSKWGIACLIRKTFIFRICYQPRRLDVENLKNENFPNKTIYRILRLLRFRGCFPGHRGQNFKII